MPLRKLGIVVDSLDQSQFGLELTRNLNYLANYSLDTDIIVFREESTPLPATPNFGIMHMKELWRYEGIGVATSLATAKKVIDCPCLTDRYYYVWQFEWLYNNSFTVSSLNHIFCNPAIKLIAKTEREYHKLSKIWREPIGIIEEFNYEQLQQLLGRTPPNSR